MKEIDFNPATMTRATAADIARIYRQLWGVELETKDNHIDTTYYTLYETRGDLLDAAAEAAFNERQFYMSAQLADMNDQIKLIEHITNDVQADYFLTDPRTPAQRDHDEAGADLAATQRDAI